MPGGAGEIGEESHRGSEVGFGGGPKPGQTAAEGLDDQNGTAAFDREEIRGVTRQPGGTAFEKGDIERGIGAIEVGGIERVEEPDGLGIARETGEAGEVGAGLRQSVLDAGKALDKIAPADLSTHLGAMKPGGKNAPGRCPGLERDGFAGENAEAVQKDLNPGKSGGFGVMIRA